MKYDGTITAIDVTEIVENDNCYYCDENGIMVKSTTKIGEKYYSFNSETGVYTGLFTGTFDNKDIVNGVEVPEV